MQSEFDNGRIPNRTKFQTDEFDFSPPVFRKITDSSVWQTVFVFIKGFSDILWPSDQREYTAKLNV